MGESANPASRGYENILPGNERANRRQATPIILSPEDEEEYGYSPSYIRNESLRGSASLLSASLQQTISTSAGIQSHDKGVDHDG